MTKIVLSQAADRDVNSERSRFVISAKIKHTRECFITRHDSIKSRKFALNFQLDDLRGDISACDPKFPNGDW